MSERTGGDYSRVNADALKNYVTEVFLRLGVRRDDALVTADNLVTADLRGVESHGVQRLRFYVGKIQKGLLDPRAMVSVVRETPATALVDGGNGLGQPAGKFGMEICLRKAEQVGGAFVAVRNSNHYGIAGYYALMALPRNLIGLSFTNAGALTAPTFGRERMVGTNPISIAVPGDKQRPFVLDMATSAVAAGKLEVYNRKGLPIPVGWAVDKEGRPTTNAAAIGAGGAMMPLGGTAETAGYKGYGLAVMVDVLCGVLSGAGFGLHLPMLSNEQPTNTGHFFMAINPDAFRPLVDFKAAMDQMLIELKESSKAEGESRIYVAGEKEFENEDDARQNGIPLLNPVIEEIKKIGIDVGVEWKIN